MTSIDLDFTEFPIDLERYSGPDYASRIAYWSDHGYTLYIDEQAPEEFWIADTPCAGCRTSGYGERQWGSALHQHTGAVFRLSLCLDCVRYIVCGEIPEDWSPE